MKFDKLVQIVETKMRSKIKVNNELYDWDAKENGYFGQETSTGVYGAVLNKNGKWIPAWINDGEYTQIADESKEAFDDLEDAINRSHLYFS